MTLYNCKAEGGSYRITKFTDDMDVESSYLTSFEACDCPAGVRSTCRHRIMLPRFIAHEATHGEYFFDYDASKWIRASSADAQHELSSAEVEVGPMFECPTCGGDLADEGHEPTCAANDRQTFSIPEGYEAVRDAEGRATGEIRPCAEGGPHCEPELTGLQEEMILMGFHQPKLCRPTEGGAGTSIGEPTLGEAPSKPFDRRI